MKKYENKSILIIGAGMLQVPAIKIASEKGLTTIVTDYNKDAPASMTAVMGSSSASGISCEWTRTTRGSPCTRQRPLTSR